MDLDYYDYINSKKWKHFAKFARRTANYRCERCGTGDRPLHCHHLSYRNLGRETLQDVEILCDGCHFFEHHAQKGSELCQR